ncbi:MAG: transglycosylase SLT domain-containing protein [Candidatus Delongbacteria bacterium]|nr:transglycosylase SLT domain-containing protein [Candidatus Delongbacteria bacterium]MBN2833899.1 transglycosylase SLT domain-containing protein [Candidatus Delongbacteria bacterium]
MDVKVTEALSQIKNEKIDKIKSDLSTADDKKLKQSCLDFESIFVKMMLDEMQKSTSLESSFGSGAGGAFYRDIYFNEISKKISESNDIGIASTMYKQLTGKEMNPEDKKDIRPISSEDRISESVLSNGSLLRGFSISNPLKDTLKYENLIEKYADEYGVDSTLVKSVIYNESGGNYRAVSSAGAKGLMQLMDGTSEDMGVSNPFRPADNIQGGVKYLSKLLKKYNNDIELTLAAYNAGPGNVDKYGGIPPFKETINYVKKVMKDISVFEE